MCTQTSVSTSAHTHTHTVTQPLTEVWPGNEPECAGKMESKREIKKARRERRGSL